MDQVDSSLRRPVPLAWQILILLTSVVVLLVLAVSLLVPLPPEVKRVLNLADVAVCLVFLADFFLLLALHKDRRRYFLTWGWLDLISSIPVIDPLRWGRLARVLRLLRLFRGLRGSAGLLRRLATHRQETAALTIIAILLFVVAFSSVAILVAEEGSGSKIDTAEDALWWTLTTMTTVGYGDLAPVTTLGRVVAVFTMFAGIGVFGAFTALVASFLVRPRGDHAVLVRIEERLEKLESALRLHGAANGIERSPKGPEAAGDQKRT